MIIGMANVYYAYNSLLCILQVLHCIWFYMIARMVYFYVFKGEVPSVTVFTARCYASAVGLLAVGLCPSVSVRLSQVGVLSKRLNESSWALACELPCTRPTLC